MSEKTKKADPAVSVVALSSITVNDEFNPRREIEDSTFPALVESIKKNGILQPLLVRPAEDGGYELIAGERRYTAAKKAGVKEVPVLVRSDVNGQASTFALIENIQRADLNPIDKARAYQALMKEHDENQKQIAARLGVSAAHVSEHLRLLRLPEPAQRWIADGALPVVASKTIGAISRINETFAVHVAAICASGQVDATKLDSEFERVACLALERVGKSVDDLPVLECAIPMWSRVELDSFSWSDERVQLRRDIEALRESHYWIPRWSDEDVDAARAYGCLLEHKYKVPGGGEYVVRIGFDNEFLLDRLEMQLEERRQLIESRERSSAPAAKGSAAEPDHREIEERRKDNERRREARNAAQARNEDFGRRLRTKLHAPKLTVAHMRWLALTILFSHRSLAGAGFAFVDEAMIEKETKEFKNGNSTTKVSFKGDAEAEAILVERVMKAKTIEEILGVVLQAQIAAEFVDLDAVPQSYRTYCHMPEPIIAEKQRSEILDHIRAEAVKALPEGEAAALRKELSAKKS
jgi:ParB/RepB/Spo0J family partition protein